MPGLPSGEVERDERLGDHHRLIHRPRNGVLERIHDQPFELRVSDPDTELHRLACPEVEARAER